MLLKSWAMPPVSWPTASIFCARNSASGSARGLVRLAQLGDVVRDAEDAEDAPVLVAVDAFRDEIGLLLAPLRRRHAFEQLRRAGREHLPIGFDERTRRPLRGRARSRCSDDFAVRLADEPAERFVDENVAPVEILDEDRVGRGFDDRVQDIESCSGSGTGPRRQISPEPGRPRGAFHAKLRSTLSAMGVARELLEVSECAEAPGRNDRQQNENGDAWP